MNESVFELRISLNVDTHVWRKSADNGLTAMDTMPALVFANDEHINYAFGPQMRISSVLQTKQIRSSDCESAESAVDSLSLYLVSVLFIV